MKYIDVKYVSGRNGKIVTINKCLNCSEISQVTKKYKCDHCLCEAVEEGDYSEIAIKRLEDAKYNGS